jgi:hypothetical protein
MRLTSFGPTVLKVVVGGLAAASLLVAPPQAFAQATPAPGAKAPAATSAPAAKPAGWTYVEKANAAVAATPGTEDLAPVLFPALAAMKPAPAAADGLDASMLLSPTSKGWQTAADWAKAPEQQAALKALATITDPKKKYLLAIPYGTQGLDPAWVKAGLCVELPPSGLLQGAKYKYRAPLERLLMLVNVEATRVASEGKADEALTLCTRWLRLARIVAEREGVRERRWGMNQMILACERMRDIAYVYRDKLTAEQTRNASDDLDERLIGVKRIRLPMLERLAADQLVERVIIEKGEVDPAKFASTMARLSADQRSLNLFGQAAWYRELAAAHAGWFDTRDQIQKVFGGWANRWNVENLHDDLLQIPSDYLKMDKSKFALVELTANEIEGLEALRLELLTQLAGTRVALGVVGYERKEKRWPPNVSAVAPAYVRTLDPDPYGYDKRFKNLLPFYYKVPIRDDVKKEREEPKPHEMTVGVGTSASAAAGPDPVLTAMAKGFTATIKTGQWSTINPADIDFESMLKDIEGTKKQLIAKAGQVNLSDADLAITADALKLAPDLDAVNPEQLKQLVTAGFKSLGAQGEAAMAKLETLMGVPIDDFFIMLAQIDNATNKAPAVKELRTAAKNGTKLTNDMVKKASIAGTEVLTSDTALLTKYLSTMAAIMKAPLGAAIRQSIGMGDPSQAASSFTVTITQKDFLLWSSGPDARDDQAKSVGSGGSDTLIWPPILSLRRANAGG